MGCCVRVKPSGILPGRPPGFAQWPSRFRRLLLYNFCFVGMVSFFNIVSYFVSGLLCLYSVLLGLFCDTFVWADCFEKGVDSVLKMKGCVREVFGYLLTITGFYDSWCRKTRLDETSSWYSLVSKLRFVTSWWSRIEEFDSSGVAIVSKSLQIIIVYQKLQRFLLFGYLN